MSNDGSGSSAHPVNGQEGVAPRSPARRVMRLAVPTAILLVLGVLGYRLAVAPIAGVRNAAECDSAYAHARTAADSNVVHFLSYPDSTQRSARCGYRNPQVARDFAR